VVFKEFRAYANQKSSRSRMPISVKKRLAPQSQYCQKKKNLILEIIGEHRFDIVNLREGVLK
jgi:hypothetical protein